MTQIAGRGARAVGLWLAGIAGLVLAMIVLGGLTRLTGSGLSMVEWRPLTGILPPMSEAEWNRLFTAYRQFPEFQKVNFWMTLADFKAIFWLEYLHRLLGRLVGIAFALPFVYFLIRRRIPQGLMPRLIGLFILGGAQGALGWYMVQSGLVDRPDVSHYRLAAHLGLAVLIYGALFWTALGLLIGRSGAKIPQAGADRTFPAFRRAAWVLVGWTGLTLLAGALVAGLDAGLAYNSFPLMGGQILPADMLHPRAGLAFTDNPAAVQFTHRALGIALVLLAVGIWIAGRRAGISGRPGRAMGLTAGAALLQAGLGIATLLSYVALPIAALHQLGAIIVLSLALWAAYELRAPG